MTMPKKSFHAPKNHRMCRCRRVHQTAQKQMAAETEKLYRWPVISTVKSVIQVQNVSKESAIVFRDGLAMERSVVWIWTITYSELIAGFTLWPLFSAICLTGKVIDQKL